MSERPSISFAKLSTPKKGNVILLAAKDAALSAAAQAADPDGVVARAAAASEFKGKLAATMDILAPAGNGYGKLSVVGAGEVSERNSKAWARIGGAACGACAKDGETSLIAELPDGGIAPDAVAAIAMGMLLRAYRFDKYKTKKNGDDKPKAAKVTICVAGEERAPEKSSPCVVAPTLERWEIV